MYIFLSYISNICINIKTQFDDNDDDDDDSFHFLSFRYVFIYNIVIIENFTNYCILVYTRETLNKTRR